MTPPLPNACTANSTVAPGDAVFDNPIVNRSGRLLNARAAVPVRYGVEVVARVINITDRRYAENATFTATEKERLTPGSPRMNTTASAL